MAVSVVMCTHVYKFAGHYYLQKSGGPIGLRSTACLAAMVMKLLDIAFEKLLRNNGLEWLLYFWYVDDNRLFFCPLVEGCVWQDGQFKVYEKQRLLDTESGVSDQSRTTREVVKAMSSLVSYLIFEGEDHEMFNDLRLPTLDTAIWWNGEKEMYTFF